MSSLSEPVARVGLRERWAEAALARSVAELAELARGATSPGLLPGGGDDLIRAMLSAVFGPRHSMWIVAALLGGGLASCFTESPVDCPVRSNGCQCSSDSVCDGVLVCNNDNNCISPDCVDGTELCPCYGNGTCDGALACNDNLCKPGGSAETAAVGTVTGGGSGGSGATADATRGSTSAVDGASTSSSTGAPTSTTETGASGDTSSSGASTGPSCAPGRLNEPCNEELQCTAGLVCQEIAFGAGSICTIACGDAAECAAALGAGATCPGATCVFLCFEDGPCPPGLDCIDDAVCGHASCVP